MYGRYPGYKCFLAFACLAHCGHVCGLCVAALVIPLALMPSANLVPDQLTVLITHIETTGLSWLQF